MSETSVIDALSSNVRRIEELEATEQSSRPRPAAKPPKKKPVEKVGTGDDKMARRQLTAGIVKKLRIKFEKAMRAGNNAKANELRERIKQVIAAGQ